MKTSAKHFGVAVGP